jgi:hypothetical protein
MPLSPTTRGRQRAERKKRRIRCPECGALVSWRRKGGNIALTKHETIEAGDALPCDANAFEYEPTLCGAVYQR